MSRLPSTGPSLQRYLRQQARTAQRQQQSSAFNLSGVTVTTDGLSIPNDVLVSPVVPQSIYASVSNFALTTTPTTLQTTTITVPAGMTSSVVTVMARVFAINPNTTGGPAGTGLDYLFCHPTVGAVSGAEMPLVATGSQGSAMNVSPLSTVLTGLTGGGTFTITVNASTDYLSWSAYTNNVAEISGNILWFR